MGQKISQYTVELLVFGNDDLFDVSELVSTGPDVWQTEKVKYSTLANAIGDYVYGWFVPITGTDPGTPLTGPIQFDPAVNGSTALFSTGAGEGFVLGWGDNSGDIINSTEYFYSYFSDTGGGYYMALPTGETGQVDLSTSNLNLFYEDASAHGGSMSITPTYAQLEFHATNYGFFKIENQLMTISHNYASFGGAKYAADYSLNFTARSLVDKAYVDGLVTGLVQLVGSTDCSANPNYPAGSKGDSYYVTVAGRIGGGAGKLVDIGDVYVCLNDNAGGNEAAVGADWFVLEHNLTGVALTSGTLAQFAATTSAQLAGVISDETGSGSLVFANAPTLVNPVVGTQSANDNSTKAASTAYVDTADALNLKIASNLSDVNNPLTARTNLGIQTLKLASNVTTTLDTAGDITGLAASVATNSIYYFNGSMHIGCNNTGGVKFAITIPGSATIWVAFMGRTSAASGAVTTFVNATGTLTTTALNIVNDGNGNVIVSGTVTTGGTAGTVQFQFASTTAGQTSTVYQEGTTINCWKIA